MIQAGRKAPKFLLQDKDGERHSLESFRTDRVVLFFYPKDDTPGCTLESQQFSKELGKFKKLGVTVVGISGGDNRSKAKFCVKHKLSVPLLSDPDFSTSEAYGVYGEKTFMGRKYKGINRATFVVNAKKGLVEKVFDSVDPDGHAQEVLAYLRGEEPGMQLTMPLKMQKTKSVKKSSGRKNKKVARKGAASAARRKSKSRK